MKTVSHIRTKAKITPASCLSWILFNVSVTALYFIVSSTIAYAGQVTLGWDKSTEPDVAGYKIYYGTATRNYTQNVKISSPNITTCTIINLTDGQKYYFAATAYNAELIESDYSAEVFTTITPATTSVPTTTTTVQPTTTTTVQPTTSSSTTSVKPTTTTTVQPTTSSSTTSLKQTTTTTVQPTTSSSTTSLMPTTTTTVEQTTTTIIEQTTTTTVQPTTSTSIYSGGGGSGGGGSVGGTNTTPIADAGADQSAFDGDLITLDGTGSYDHDGDTLTYQWAQISGSTVSLSDDTAPQPEFYAPAAGTFTFSLVVSDGQASSVLDTVTITVKEVDNRPIAMAGNDLTVQIGDKVVLDGTASNDSDGDTLSYKWIQVSGPAVNLSNPDSATPYFIAAIEGKYQFNLTVFDGILWSLTDSIVITIKQPTINLISPSIDVKISGSVKLTWNGTGFAKYKVLVSKDGKSFTSLGETTNQDYTLSALTMLNLIARKNKTIYWKIQGQRSVQNDYWVSSETRKFYVARTLKIYQNAIRELLTMILNKQNESPPNSD